MPPHNDLCWWQAYRRRTVNMPVQRTELPTSNQPHKLTSRKLRLQRPPNLQLKAYSAKSRTHSSFDTIFALWSLRHLKQKLFHFLDRFNFGVVSNISYEKYFEIIFGFCKIYEWKFFLIFFCFYFTIWKYRRLRTFHLPVWLEIP